MVLYDGAKAPESRPARGAWVEMLINPVRDGGIFRRAPQGARGLKSEFLYCMEDDAASRPARGAWVEIPFDLSTNDGTAVAPRKGRVG